ncbi:MAG TPA: AGE family epimerase/isomerase [Anaerolineae bacterium]|nr:AGE family epimerase/isomerase [Anaerolineae bacterium]
MKRRSFLGATIGTAAIAPGITGCSVGQEQSTGSSLPEKRVTYPDGTLAGKTLEQLYEQYRYDLFDDFLAFFDRYIVDTEYGGFICSTDHDGSHITTDKNATTMGRGIWCYSFLYNNIAKEDKYLDIASKAVEFIIRHRPAGDNYWPTDYTREGEVKNSRGSLPGDCYIGEGLSEYAKATGEKKYMDMAKETMYKALKQYDSPDFRDSASPYPGARNLWYWMLFMWFCTNTLKHESDPELEKLVARCVDAIMNHHQNPKFDLMNNVINHDLSFSQDPKYSELAGCGHATEALWMIMYEAERTKDKKLFETAAERFRRHVEVSQDDVYGGVFNDLTNVDENIWQLDKILWAEVFVLIGSLFVIEHTGAQWAKDMFSKQFIYVQDKFPLKQYGYSLWADYADRKVTFVPHATRKDIYHHPRHLMLNYLSVERMIKRNGKISGIFG